MGILATKGKWNAGHGVLDALEPIHPEGEPQSRPGRPAGNWPVDTPGDRVYAEGDPEAPVTREGRLVFFFQFLHVGGRWEELLRDCPIRYTGNRGSGARNVLGTAMLSVLSGQSRYPHISGGRGDSVDPGLPGMGGAVSDDTVRLGIGRIEENVGLDWLRSHRLASIARALGMPWILDIDGTVKPLCGRQQGAAVGYNPHKPGRPSHVYHSDVMANLIALVYNWWALYLRFYDEEHPREALRTRPLLMAAVARQVQRGGQRSVKVSLLHKKGDLIAIAVTRIINELQHIRAITPRWSADRHWSLLPTRLLRRWLGGKWLPRLPNEAAILLGG